MPRRQLRPLLVVVLAAAASMLVAAPAVGGPRRAAEAALASLDDQSYHAVVAASSVVSVRGAEPRVARLLALRWRIVMVQAVESPSRVDVAFVSGPPELRGVRVVEYDGTLYVSRNGGPVRRAAGGLRSYLLDVLFPRVGTNVVGAERLPSASRSGRALRHLRVRFDIKQQLPAFERAIATAARVSLPSARILSRAADFRPDVSDIYVDTQTGLMAEFTERIGANVPLRALVRAIGQDPRGALGTLILRSSTRMRVTGVGGVTLERPRAVGSVSSRDFLGL